MTQEHESNVPVTVRRQGYPEYLKRYERFDDVFLEHLARANQVTAKELATIVFESTGDYEIARNARKWAGSANWRNLVQSGNEPLLNRTFSISEQGRITLCRGTKS